MCLVRILTLLATFHVPSLALPTSRVDDGGAFTQIALTSSVGNGHVASPPKKLTGRFLHITGISVYSLTEITGPSANHSNPDIHPDPFFVVGSDPDQACHHSHGPAGRLGAETSDCDSPISLVNATFTWLQHNLRDSIDFVIWTGDSARHDNDERIPRNTSQIIEQNTFILEKFREVWGKDGHGRGESEDDFKIPVIPTFGNNDVLPHNIMWSGPNEWTRRYLRLWKRLVPEAQRHSFDRGGWFYVEVIPKKLAVFSLNTMYFFGNNAAVDGCDDVREPGYEQFEWLRIQLQLLREQGVKVILTGHVPPARNDQKEMWTESCWMKYALWVKQYRDIVLGSMWGHMNVEHFFLQDFNDIIWDADTEALLGDDHEEEDAGEGTVVEDGEVLSAQELRRRADKVEVKVKPPNYLNALREQFSALPSEPDSRTAQNTRKGKQSPQDRYHDAIGGDFAERYAVSFVSASVVPNFFPTLRVFEYNITGLEHSGLSEAHHTDADGESALLSTHDDLQIDKKKKHKRRRKGRKQKPHFSIPHPPSSSDLPGPAYAPQSLSLIGYEQLYANLTRIQRRNRSAIDSDGHSSFQFEREYDTRDEDDVYGLSAKAGGLGVRNMLRLASKIGSFQPKETDKLLPPLESGTNVTHDISSKGEEFESSKKKRKKKKKHRKIINKIWYTFVDRALVGTVAEKDLHKDYGQ